NGLGFSNPSFQSLEFYDPTPGQDPGDGVVLVGGLGGVFRLLDSPSGPYWSQYGTGLPNAVVTDLHYIPINRNQGFGDLLLAGTYGRGAWLVPNASQTLATPELLRIVGDQDFNGENDTIRLMADPSNSSLLDVFLNNATAQPDLVVPFAVLQGIQV